VGDGVVACMTPPTTGNKHGYDSARGMRNAMDADGNEDHCVQVPSLSTIVGG
jgi:hypothetical protein